MDWNKPDALLMGIYQDVSRLSAMMRTWQDGMYEGIALTTTQKSALRAKAKDTAQSMAEKANEVRAMLG